MSKKTKALVSIVVLSWNTLEETSACLEQLRKIDYDNYEIVILDNGSKDGSKEYLSKQNDITYIDLPENTGFTGGQTNAYKECKGDYIALVNSDAVVAENWVSALVDEMEKDESIGATGGRAYTWEDHQKPFDTKNSYYSYQIVDKKYGYARTSLTGSEKMEVDSISGAGVMISRKAIDDIGYFDDIFFAYYEETDLFARMKRAGYKIVYVPEAHIWHMIAKSSSGDSYFYLYQMQRNRFIFAYKNFDSKYLKYLLYRYFMDGIRASLKYLRHKDAYTKAQKNAFIWNLKNLPKTNKLRSEVQKSGNTYSGQLKNSSNYKDITVVIPCYNYEDYIGEAIQSVLNQTQKADRIIVIDDGSKDSSVEKINKYSDKVEIIAKENEGVIATKNQGISMTDTTWIMFLDADDVLPKDYIEKVLDNAEAQESDVAYTDMVYFGSKDKKIRAGEHHPGRLLEGNYIHNSALIRTDFIKMAGGYKQEMSNGYEDWELYVSLLEVGAKFSYCNNTFLKYRQHHETSFTSRNKKAQENADELFNKVRGLHPELYDKYLKFSYKLRKRLGTIARNPELIVLMPIYILRTLLGIIKFSIKVFVTEFKPRLIHKVHMYIEKKIK